MIAVLFLQGGAMFRQRAGKGSLWNSLQFPIHPSYEQPYQEHSAGSAFRVPFYGVPGPEQQPSGR